MLGSLVEGEFFPPGGDGAYEECVGEAAAGREELSLDEGAEHPAPGKRKKLKLC